MHLHHLKRPRNKRRTRDLVQDSRLHRRTETSRETSSSRLGCNNSSSKRASSSKDRLRRKLGNSTRTCSNIREANLRTADPHSSRCQTAASNNSKVEAVQEVVQGSPKTTSSPLIRRPWDETSIPAVIAFTPFTICVQCFLCTFFTFF